MIGTKVWLGAYGGERKRGVTWAWRFPGDESYVMRYEDGAWSLSRSDVAADVVVETTPEGWARLLAAPRGSRRLTRDIELRGKPTAIGEFAPLFAADLRR